MFTKTTMMETFCEISYQRLAIAYFRKISILDIW